MSIVCLHNDQHLTVATDQQVFDSRETGALLTVCEHAQNLSKLLDSEAARISNAEQEGYRHGYTAGERSAKAEVQRQLSEDWLSVCDAMERERTHVREQAADLALAIVRRIADELESDAVIAGLARRAAQQLLPDQEAVLLVHPTRVEAIRQRLADCDLHPVHRITGDESLSTQDCVIQTSEGTLSADLETHLAALETYLRE